METRTPHLRIIILPAAFALACVLLTLGLYHAFGGALPLSAKGYRVTIPVAQAANLVPGSGVQVAGVKIGKVVEVRRTGNTAAVTIDLKARFAPLRVGTTAIVRTKTLLGEGYVQIALGPRTAAPIPDGGAIPARDVQREVQLDEFLSTFDPTAARNLRRLFTGLGDAFDGQSVAVSNSLGNAAPLTNSLAEIFATLDDQRADLQQVVSSSADVLGAVGHRQGVLRAAIQAGNRVLDTTAQHRRPLAATIKALPLFLTQLRATSNAISVASPELNAAVRAVVPSAPLVRPALRSIDRAAPEFRKLFDELPGVEAAAGRGLPSVKPIVSAARQGFRQFYPLSRELIPFVQLLALNKNIVNILANVGSLVSGTYVGSGGVVTAYTSAIASIWNETISGWARKLPTNRQNPYPKPPDGLLDTGRIGVLKAYDCRNTGNRLYLPPTGTGAPPCILQGPWTFNGKSAYYPRLTPAAP
jgi:virulence factor Mce-like protein